jgi:hypothetical protein
MKSPWQRSLHIIDSIFDTQPNFKHFVENRKIYGVSAEFILKMMAKMNDCPSFDQNDRQRLLKQSLRIILNMIPVSFEELILEEHNIDIFNPIEQLNGHCLCDFYLVKSEHIFNRMQI